MMTVKGQDTSTNTIKDPDTWVSGEDPMTGAQASYLETLAEQAHEDVPENLSKAEASKKIEEFREELSLDAGTKRH